jgi:pyridoxamine 5'-phosphate oxidase
MSISDLRRDYSLAGLQRRDLAADPLVQFNNWFAQARGAGAGSRWRRFWVSLYKSLTILGGAEPIDINAMTLATADKDGKPSARIVLLKGQDDRGFIFFTNYDSRKGRELAENPEGALVFYWPEAERQVCIAGEVSKLSQSESEKYFKSRPRGSRLAAWASKQSQPVQDRSVLERTWQALEKQYPSGDIPLPAFWGGYVLAPRRIEFWQGRPNRLHDRFCYTREDDQRWRIERLSP